jgi:hypothetical protein
MNVNTAAETSPGDCCSAGLGSQSETIQNYDYLYPITKHSNGLVELFNFGGKSRVLGQPQPASGLLTWANGSYVEGDDNQTDTALSGHLKSLNAGAALRLSDQAIAGVFGVVRDGSATARADWSTSPLDPGREVANLDSDSIGGGVFAIFRLMGDAMLSGSVQYEAGDNDFDISGFLGSTASFDSDQVTVQASLDKRFTRGRHCGSSPASACATPASIGTASSIPSAR